MDTSAGETPWQQFVRRWHGEVEAYLKECVAPRVETPPRLTEAMAYSLLATGKRLRPLLVLAACDLCGGDPRSALPAAAAIEMVHTYSLIHDDLPAMDDDDYRRGKPTNHKVFGEAIAILAGDGLLTRAFEVLSAELHPAEVAVACCLELARAAGDEGMVAGQVADLQASELSHPTLEDLEAIHRRKTGKLLCAALQLGARVAQAPAPWRDRLLEYGRHLGLAFQIVDDLLDLSGDPHKLGKQTHKDASHGKLTYPRLLGIEESQQRARDLVWRAQQALAPWEERGAVLTDLAYFVLTRDR
ncbi:MAG: farnesyl-diphosphate synthase [Planctomycetaceae bacterium]|nr:MAG: farnesyl-diphosphate synthase [Planctomycetaceae bacterium]